MSRLRTITHEQLNPVQQQIWEQVTNGRRVGGAGFVGPDGGLRGPFNALLHTPSVGLSAASLGEALRYDTSLDRRLLELATITVGARWRSNFEWAVHARLAVEAGVAAEVVEAVGDQRDPVFERADEAVVHRFTVELLHTGRVAVQTYDDALALLGDRGVVELVILAGYYCAICFALNTFEVGPPAGVEPRWPS